MARPMHLLAVPVGEAAVQEAIDACAVREHATAEQVAVYVDGGLTPNVGGDLPPTTIRVCGAVGAMREAGDTRAST